MKQFIVLLLLATLVLSSCQKQEPQKPQQQEFSQAAVEKTPEALLSEAKKNLAEAKSLLAQNGKYACCLKEPCNMCALEEGECDCYTDLEKGEHVCTECYAGWQQNKGASEKFKKEQVKTDFTKHSH